MPSVTEKWDGQAGESRGQGRLSSVASMRPAVSQKTLSQKAQKKMSHIYPGIELWQT